MKVTHTTIYTADDGTEYTDARLCAAHEQVLAKGEHAYGTIEFEKARDALAATLPVPAVALTSRESLLSALRVATSLLVAVSGDRAAAVALNGSLMTTEDTKHAAKVADTCNEEGWK